MTGESVAVRDLLTGWQFNAAAALAIAIGGAGYLVLSRRAAAWPLRRTWGFLVCGGGATIIATMSALQVYATRLSWAAACQYTLLLAVVPLGVGAGRPLDLLAAVFPKAERLLRSLGRRGSWPRSPASR